MENSTIVLEGKIEESSMHGQSYFTILTTKAKDAYSRPSTFKVKSDQAIGTPGEEVRVTCELSGYIRRKNYKDRETGMPKVFIEDNVTLSVFQVQPVTKPSEVKRAG